MLKVVHLQTHLPSSGNAAHRLHNAFLEASIDSSMLSLTSDIQDDTRIMHLGKKAQIISWINNKLQSFITRSSIRHFGLFSFPILGTNVAKMEQVKKAEVIYLHWVIGGFLSLTNIKQLAKLNKPIVFFMHDMWTITGGCHHSFECEKYKNKCTNCQMFPNNKKNDLSSLEFDKKVKLYSKFKNLYFVSPSNWLFDCARQSELTNNKPVFYIPNIIDTKLFKPFDKTIAKQILNIDPETKVISFGALSVDSPYKGWKYLQEALEVFKREYTKKNVTVLIFGSGYNKLTADALPFNTKFMGRLRDDYSTVLVYNAADVFIAPSLADNLPTTVMESMCCGTPVVAFDIGGIPDLIKHKINGYLSNYRDSEDLANGIKFCLENNIKGKMLPVFEPGKIIKEHIKLISNIIQIN
jgi:glycosyltransferase involved in cell wall biosynthesis